MIRTMIIVIIRTMILVNINQAKAKLSEYLDAVTGGERVVICKRNQPIAELRALEQKRTEPRPLGRAKGRVTIPPSFFEPMPDEFLDAFESGPVYPAGSRPSRSAERRPKSSAGTRTRKHR